jgi:hypothetical protein
MSDAADQLKERSFEAAAGGIAGATGAATSEGSERRRRAGYVMTALTLPEIVAAVLALVLWFVLFGGGSLLGTEVYRLQLAKSIAWQMKVKPMLVCLCFWTTSNLGLLACLSSFGCCGVSLPIYSGFECGLRSAGCNGGCKESAGDILSGGDYAWFWRVHSVAGGFAAGGNRRSDSSGSGHLHATGTPGVDRGILLGVQSADICGFAGAGTEAAADGCTNEA